MNRLKKVILAILIGSAVIAFWRGVWGLLDLYLFPENYLLSLLIGIIIGLTILIIFRKAVKELM